MSFRHLHAPLLFSSALIRFALWSSLSPVLFSLGVLLSVAPGEAAPLDFLAQAQVVDPRQVEADRLIQQGMVQYQASQFEAALRSWQQALTLYRESKNRRGEMNTLISIGNAYYALDDYPKVIEYQQQSLVMARELQDRQAEGNALGNLGNAYYLLGNYPKVIDYYQQTLALLKESGDRRGEGLSLGNLGFVYQAIGEYDRAIDFLQQSLTIARELQDPRFEGTVLGLIGSVYINAGKYSNAIDYLDQSLAIARKIQDRQGEGNALGNLGLVYDSLGNSSQAIQYLNQALQIVRDIQDVQSEGNILGTLGNAHLFRGEYSKAIESLQQQLAITRKIKDRRGEGNALNNLGLALFKSQKLAEAESTLLASIEVLESLRQNLQDLQKVSLAQSQRNPYIILQEVLMAQNKVESALEISERSRARAFIELLAQRTQGDKQLTIQPIKIATIKQIAREQNATLVEYSHTFDDHLLIWVVKPSGEVFCRRASLKFLKQQPLQTLIVSVRQSIGIQDRGVEFQGTIAYDVPDHSDHPELKQLYQLLIQPIQDLLPQDPQQRVIIIPQGNLFFLPFAALQAPNNQYFLEQHTIVIAPAIQVLELTRKQRQKLSKFNNKNVVVVGNPTMPQVVLKAGDVARALPSLPGSEQEAQVVARILQTTPLIGRQATKTTVVKRMSKARIIHLATHGLLNEIQGLSIPGAIALAPDDHSSGLLTTEELLDLKLQAELVVLSACNTGQGQVTGDGVIGLSRALMTAGVPSVIVTLWAVPDAPTADLMTRFYQNLQQGQDKAQALRQAMLATQKEFPDPRAWAAFTLMGEAE